MKKKFLIAFLFLSVFALIFASGASAYVVSWFNQTFEVREPIVIKVLLQSPGSTMWPGSTFTIDYEVSNQADVAYGMSYGGQIKYADAFGKQIFFPIEKQPTKDKAPDVRLLQKPEASASAYPPPLPPPPPPIPPIPPTEPPIPPFIGPAGGWGEISFMLTIDGKTQSYSPHEIVNINAGDKQLLTAKIRPSAEIPPGKWDFSLYADRQEANKTVPSATSTIAR